jgi:hypothetical protein
MKNTEIRIGNFVKRNDLIVAVDEQTFWDMKNNPEQYEPVKLTEDWLVRRFGLEKYEFDNGKLPQYRLENRLIVVRGGFFYDYGTSAELKYVHQLQNLYFALTGEELTTKK